MNKFYIEELGIEVENVSDYNDEASEILTGFCDNLEDEGKTKPVEDEDKWWAEEEGISFLWTKEAVELIEKKIKELESIGVKYFGLTLDLDISSHMYKTP